MNFISSSVTASVIEVVEPVAACVETEVAASEVRDVHAFAVVANATLVSIAE